MKVGEVRKKAGKARDEEDEASIEKQSRTELQQREPSRVKKSQPSLTNRSAIRPIAKIRSVSEASQHELMCTALVRDRGRDRGRGRYSGIVPEGKMAKKLSIYEQRDRWRDR